jgi:hypothetical protein
MVNAIRQCYIPTLHPAAGGNLPNDLQYDRHALRRYLMLVWATHMGGVLACVGGMPPGGYGSEAHRGGDERESERGPT